MRAPIRRPPIWRTALLMVLCAFASTSTLVFSELGASAEPGAGVLVFLVAMLVVLSLGWRHRAPLAVTLVAAAVAIVLPIGTSTALVALVSLFIRRFDKWLWWATAAVAVATSVTFVRDLVAPTMESSLLKTLLGPPEAPVSTPVDLNWWVAPIMVALTMGTAIAAGLVRRDSRRSSLANRRARAAGRQSAKLGDELARQVERHRIAREVHDVLGHRLSLLNLHAGALEVNASDDAKLAESAALVRASAAQSMNDLRSLLTMLREDPDQDPTMRDPSLADLPEIIDETVAAGAVVNSVVVLDDAESADPALARAVYRVVQELLTNARKHAPGAPIQLRVSGGPQRDLTIDARNAYLGSGDSSGSRQGLQGIAERVELLEGRLSYGTENDGATFRVTVRLPWRS
ncbi:sensor histidine kinase [Ruania zhangjianzhongii]|uniref:sensor histidine kinase n=1 Tax=Ruania zhangjianzhongii TaxID=2603206 RepID=UPI0011C852F1|nr:histidine kinase [Ruania zhangjianzhongii]